MTNPGQQPQYGQQPGYPQHGQSQYGQQPGYPVQPSYQPFPAMPGGDPAAKPRAPRLQGPGGLLAAAGILAVVGAVLPWATFGRLSKLGTEGDGVITLVMGMAIAAAGIWIAQRAPLGIPITALVLSTLIAAVAVIDISDVSSSGLDIGSGLWVTLSAGVLGMCAGIWALAARPGAKAAASR